MMAERAQVESRILADMAALAGADQEYADLVQAILDLVEEAVASPLLALSIHEPRGIRHYTRLAPDVDPSWGQEAVAFTADVARQHLTRPASLVPRSRQYHLAVPPLWLLLFPVSMPGGSRRLRLFPRRSARSAALALGTGQPLSISTEEEELMHRLARQAALVLDHALLLERVEDLEVTDELTGVTNQRRLLELLEYELLRHRHAEGRLAVMMIDVQGLDRINRSYGRQYGNHILSRIASLLQEVARPIDVVARSGLDEFAIILPGTDEDGGEDLAAWVRERIQSVEFAGGAIEITCAVACARPDEMLSAEGLLRRAEQAVREAKRHERSRSALRLGGQHPSRLR